MTAIVMVDGIAYTRKEGVPCYDSGLGWRECQSDESHLAGALVDAQDELATLRAQLAGVRERQNSGKIWSHVRSALDRAGDIRVGAVTYEEENAKLDEIARTCESRILAALGGDA